MSNAQNNDQLEALHNRLRDLGYRYDGTNGFLTLTKRSDDDEEGPVVTVDQVGHKLRVTVALEWDAEPEFEVSLNTVTAAVGACFAAEALIKAKSKTW